MSRYAAMFDHLNGDGAFGAFLMLGDPDLDTSARLLDDLVSGGADMIEVGIPFSDPVADGPVIQAAAKRALGAGVRVSDCLDLIARCDHVVRIPSSFCINLAMAGAIVMYDRVRCLGRVPPRPLSEGGPPGERVPMRGRKLGRGGVDP